MTRLLGVAVLAVLCLISPAAWAQSAIYKGMHVIETYYAFLGEADHFNSNGEQLTAPWQIIRQDRANYHRFGIRDSGDEWDSFFDNANNRARMESMLANGRISRQAANAVVNNLVWVRVDLLGSGNRVTAVQVEVE
jgi:hypothetical protein